MITNNSRLSLLDRTECQVKQVITNSLSVSQSLVDLNFVQLEEFQHCNFRSIAFWLIESIFTHLNVSIAVLGNTVHDDCFCLLVNLIETALFIGLFFLDNLNNLALSNKELLDSHIILC